MMTDFILDELSELLKDIKTKPTDIMTHLLKVAGIAKQQVASSFEALNILKIVTSDATEQENLEKIQAFLSSSIEASKTLDKREKKAFLAAIEPLSKTVLAASMLYKEMNKSEDRNEQEIERLKKAYTASHEVFKQALNAPGIMGKMRHIPGLELLLNADLMTNSKLQMVLDGFATLSVKLSTLMTKENIKKLGLSAKWQGRAGAAQLAMQAAEALGLEDKFIKSNFFNQVIARVKIPPKLAEHIVRSVAPVAKAAFSGAIQGSVMVPGIGTLIGALVCGGAVAAKAVYDGYGIWKQVKQEKLLLEEAQELSDYLSVESALLSSSPTVMLSSAPSREMAVTPGGQQAFEALKTNIQALGMDIEENAASPNTLSFFSKANNSVKFQAKVTEGKGISYRMTPGTAGSREPIHQDMKAVYACLAEAILASYSKDSPQDAEGKICTITLGKKLTDVQKTALIQAIYASAQNKQIPVDNINIKDKNLGQDKANNKGKPPKRTAS